MTMNLYILRHAKADREPSNDDYNRKLKPSGVKDSRLIGQALARLETKFDRICTSPRLRARQTAQLVAGEMAGTPAVEEIKALAESFGLTQLSSLCSDLPAGGSILIVGHEPTLSQLILQLTGGMVEMKTAALAHLECDVIAQDQAVLKCLINPGLVETWLSSSSR